MFIDTHTHLYLEEFDTDREAMLQRAFEAGVTHLFLPNIDEQSVAPMEQMRAQHPDRCFPMMGLHPCSVKADYEEVLERLKQQLDTRKYYAIGETGIDLYWDRTFIAEQKLAFRAQISWAKNYDLPLVIHARDSFPEILEILDELNDTTLRGIFHCFTGTAQQAQHILNYGGFKLGIGGVLTYKNAGLDKTLASVSPEALLLETDSPYLAPVPYRGKRNESAYVKRVAERLAEVYSCSLEEIAAITTRNARALFGI